VYGADGSGTTKPSELNWKNPVVLIMGNEHAGIPPYLAKLCDNFASIPMMPGVESLNVSVATGILLYESLTHRIQ